VIVHVATTPAPEQDGHVLEKIHADLAARHLTPAEHLLDSGYVTPAAIHRAAHEHGIDLLGPVRLDPRAKEHPGFTKEDLAIDGERHTLTCPQKVTSPAWRPTMTDGQPGFSVLFFRKDCRACPVRLKCTGNVEGKGRHVLVLPRPLQEIQIRARAEQQAPPWRERHAMRAGCVEAINHATVHRGSPRAAAHYHGARRVSGGRQGVQA
jgi:hypothetical protein